MTKRANYWAKLLGSWERSGLSQAEFCRRRGIKAVNFAWWKRRLRGPRSPVSKPGRRGKGPGPFVEVRLAGASSSSAYEVVLAGGRSIRVPSQFDPQILSGLITAVESC
jgi:hypothetical protein